MSNVVPAKTKVSPEPSEFRTVADFNLARTLLQKYSLYNIPDNLRQSVINQAGATLNGNNSSTIEKIAAAKLILEMDKQNLTLVKIAMPQKHEHFDVKEATTEELLEALENARSLLPKGFFQESTH